MTKRIYILLAIAVLTAIGIIIALTTRPAEPSYDGKKLTEWLTSTDDKQERSNVVRQIGPRAVPTLLRLLQAKDSAVKSNLITFAAHFADVHYIPAEKYHRMAFIGFNDLRADAQDAVPGLIRILQQPPYGEAQSIAAMSLALIGPPASNAVLPLLRAATNSQANVRSASLRALGKIQARTDLVVPLLIDTLRHDGAPLIRNYAALSLRDFGTNALPALIQAFNDAQPALASPRPSPEDIFQASALRTIRLIDPATAAKLSSTNSPSP